MLRLVVIVVRALLLATLRRLRHGPSLPTWSWTLEWLVADYRDGLRGSMRLEPAGFRALAAPPPVSVAPVALDPVELGGVPALRLRNAKSTTARSLLYIHGGGWVVGSPQAVRKNQRANCGEGSQEERRT